jgi:hypothetical protein
MADFLTGLTGFNAINLINYVSHYWNIIGSFRFLRRRLSPRDGAFPHCSVERCESPGIRYWYTASTEAYFHR